MALIFTASLQSPPPPVDVTSLEKISQITNQLQVSGQLCAGLCMAQEHTEKATQHFSTMQSCDNLCLFESVFLIQDGRSRYRSVSFLLSSFVVLSHSIFQNSYGCFLASPFFWYCLVLSCVGL